jgi:thiamine-phosphate pyrophosphorylase
MLDQQTAIHRILDANLDRAREGLRTIEEWCRFGLNNQEMANNCKQMRQELASCHKDEYKLARDTANDVGTQLTHPQEESRETLTHLLQANLARVQEALRVLEEYGKLSNSQLASKMKQMRYQTYTLETDLLGKSPQKLLSQCSLYLVTSPVNNLLTVVESALKGGLKLVQYRSKNENDGIRWQQAQALKQLCDRYGALFLVNDRVDLALAVDADGVHLGQTDLPVAVARQILGKHKIIGQSTTNPEEMAKALATDVDYIGVGPVYETPTKAGKKASGLEYIRYAKENATVPWFAIGGIDNSNVENVVAAGATRVAVVRAIMEADNPQTETQEFLGKLV